MKNEFSIAIVLWVYFRSWKTIISKGIVSILVCLVLPNVVWVKWLTFYVFLSFLAHMTFTIIGQEKLVQSFIAYSNLTFSDIYFFTLQAAVIPYFFTEHFWTTSKKCSTQNVPFNRWSLENMQPQFNQTDNANAPPSLCRYCMNA